MSWVKDREGNLVNLAHCSMLVVEENLEAGEDELRMSHVVIAKEKVLNTYECHELFVADEVTCQAWMYEKVGLLG